MRDLEFSAPGAEFSAPREEFTPPAAEFFPAGQEYHTAGAEFSHNTAVSPKRKTRRITSLMLTAAAVVTAAMVIAGVGLESAGSLPDPLQLNAEQWAYMEELSGALENQDHKRLIELAQEPMLVDLLENTVVPYCESLSGEYEGDLYNGVYQYGDGNISLSFTYDRDDGFVYPYDFAMNEDREDWCQMDIYVDTETLSSISIEQTEAFDYVKHKEKPYDYFAFSCSILEDGSVPSWEKTAMVSQTKTVPYKENGKQYNIILDGAPLEGTSVCRRGEDVLTINGSFACFVEEPDPENGGKLPLPWHYLENGTVTWQTLGQDGTLTNMMSAQVEDGSLVKNDQVVVTQDERTDGRNSYYIGFLAEKAPSYTLTFAQLYAQSEEEALRYVVCRKRSYWDFPLGEKGGSIPGYPTDS